MQKKIEAKSFSFSKIASITGQNLMFPLIISKNNSFSFEPTTLQ